MRLVLYQPDIAQNTGTILRLAACFGVAVDIIEPAGFFWSEAKFRRAGMDYLDRVAIRRHRDYASFDSHRRDKRERLVLLSTSAATPYQQFAFKPGDLLMLGRESAGVPDHVHHDADARVVIPMRPGLRSLNVAISAGIVLAEALRQTGGLPNATTQDETITAG